MKRFVEGADRSQSTLLPECLDDWVDESNPVRAVDAFVDALNLGKIGFDGIVPEVTGRPSYHPSALLKLYIYGYLNRIQSSRRLEREAGRNLEVIWLLKQLAPDDKTIADFRKDNGSAIRQVCARFVVLCRDMGLLTKASVAIDGSKFKAVNTRDKNFTKGKVERRRAQLEDSVARYLAQLDTADLAEVEAAMRGVDCVVHLGAIAGEDTWDKILPNNVIGTWNVFEAARRQGVPRVIYASSHHAVGFYRRTRFIDQMVIPRPDGIYGVSKVFGEAVGRLFADKHGLSVACLRIGAFRDKPADRRLLHVWLSPRDAVQLVGCCIDAPDYHFVVIYGVSNNTRNRYRNAGTEFLGYRPQDNSEDFAADILPTPDTEDAISREFHGGPYTQMGFDGDLARIE